MIKAAKLRGTLIFTGKSLSLYYHVLLQKNHKNLQAGGLYVLGTTRHESRRIDNQLRGRAGRQAGTVAICGKLAYSHMYHAM